MERSISISELSAENAVAVVNAYVLILGDKEHHVDNSTTEVCRYLCDTVNGKVSLFDLDFEKLI